MDGERPGLREEIITLMHGLTEIIEMIEASPVQPAIRHDCPKSPRRPLDAVLPDEARDEEALLGRALGVITEIGYVSPLVLQVRMGVTYRQAVRLVRELERLGYVEDASGWRPRRVMHAAYSAEY